MKISTQRLWIYEIEKAWSNKNEELYYTLRLWDNDNGYTYITYVSQENYNSNQWGEILNWWQPGVTICISGDFKTARGKPWILNADSKITYEGQIATQDFCDLVYELWKSDIDPMLNGTHKVIDLTDYFT